MGLMENIPTLSSAPFKLQAPYYVQQILSHMGDFRLTCVPGNHSGSKCVPIPTLLIVMVRLISFIVAESKT